MSDLTLPEMCCFIGAFAIITRGLAVGLEVQDAGVALFLLGLVPIRRADRKREP
jgi:hypothetical protein